MDNPNLVWFRVNGVTRQGKRNGLFVVCQRTSQKFVASMVQFVQPKGSFRQKS